MLDKFFQSFRTFVVVLLVSLLAAVFVLQFGGPQAQGCTEGGTAVAAKVGGKVITAGDFQAAYTLGNFHRSPLSVQRSMDLKRRVLDGLIERSLLADRARDLGYHVTDTDVMEHLAEEGTVYLSLGAGAPPNLPQGEIPVPVKDRDGRFDLESAKRFIVNYLGRSIAEFAEGQAEETLAFRMKETVRATATVGQDEVWSTWVRDVEKTRIEYARFTPRFYEKDLMVTDPELDGWIAKNAETLDKSYEVQKHRYTGLDQQIRGRAIYFKVDEAASDEERAAKRSEAENVLAQIRAGRDFVELAKTHSDDPNGRRGGDLGWTPKGRLPDPVDEALFALEAGKVSDVVDTVHGFYVLRADKFREGDIPADEAKREIAETLMLEARAEAMAEKAAADALAKWKSGLDRDALDRLLRGEGPATAPDNEEEAEVADAPASEEPAVDPLAPKVEDSGDFRRADSPVSGPFDSSPLAQAAFEHTPEAPFPDKPVQLGRDFFVFKVVDQTLATKEAFTDDEKRRIWHRIRFIREREAVEQFVADLRTRAEERGSIRVEEELLKYSEEETPET